MATITLTNREVSAILNKKGVSAVNGREVQLSPYDISFAGQRAVRTHFPGAKLHFETGKIIFEFETDEDAVLYRMKRLSL